MPKLERRNLTSLIFDSHLAGGSMVAPALNGRVIGYAGLQHEHPGATSECWIANGAQRRWSCACGLRRPTLSSS